MHEKKVGGKSQTTWIRSGMNGGLHEERLCESEINFDPAGPLSSSWTTSSSGHALGVFEFRNLTDLSMNSPFNASNNQRRRSFLMNIPWTNWLPAAIFAEQQDNSLLVSRLK